MRRKIYDELVRWKAEKGQECLTVKGQRQVGKTYIIDKFASENYAHKVYIDFNRNPELMAAFENGISVDSIVKELSIRMEGSEFVPYSTIVVLDEIQECPRARSSLKYFALDERYDVIASGSLLGVTNTNAKKKSDKGPMMPMGYERVITLRSMDFEEYLWAINFPQDILDQVKEKVLSRTPLDQAEFEVLSRHFRSFMIVGGMPASVHEFVEKGSFSDSGSELDKIVGSIVNDINRYNDPINSRKTQRCFESIPEQLGFSNKKFQYSRVDKGSGSRASAEKYLENLLWVESAGYGNFCYSLESPLLPFKRIDDSFRVYMSDTGILVRMMGVSAARAIYDGAIGFNMGAIMENEVAECISKCGFKPYFYRKSSGKNQMELDFVIDLGGESVVIEVKSGKDRSAPSIHKVRGVFPVDRRMIFEDGNIRVDGEGIEHYPLFAAAFIGLLEKESPVRFRSSVCKQSFIN